jgi:hypothetical protein
MVCSSLNVGETNVEQVYEVRNMDENSKDYFPFSLDPKLQPKFINSDCTKCHIMECDIFHGHEVAIDDEISELALPWNFIENGLDLNGKIIVDDNPGAIIEVIIDDVVVAQNLDAIIIKGGEFDAIFVQFTDLLIYVGVEEAIKRTIEYIDLHLVAGFLMYLKYDTGVLFCNEVPHSDYITKMLEESGVYECQLSRTCIALINQKAFSCFYLYRYWGVVKENGEDLGIKAVIVNLDQPHIDVLLKATNYDECKLSDECSRLLIKKRSNYMMLEQSLKEKKRLRKKVVCDENKKKMEEMDKKRKQFEYEQRVSRKRREVIVLDACDVIPSKKQRVEIVID